MQVLARYLQKLPGQTRAVGETCLYGLAAGGIIPTMNALVGRLIPPSSYGKAYGLTSSMTALGMAAGPFVGAAILETIAAAAGLAGMKVVPVAPSFEDAFLSLASGGDHV